MSRKGAGQPRKYASPEEMAGKIEEYFAEKKENPAEITMAGLSLACGFPSRQNFHDYLQLPEYSYILTSAKSKVEESYEIFGKSGKTPSGFAVFMMNRFSHKCDKDDKDESDVDKLADALKQVATSLK